MIQKMNILDKLHQEFVIKKVQDTDWNTSSSGPLVVELDTTEACNLACPGCISEDLVCNQTSFSSERLLQLGEEMYNIGVKAVILIGGGEPLAHPAVGDLMQYLGEHDISIGITTNGSFIDKHLDVISQYSSWTRVSMDAATSETFEKLRPSKNGKNEFEHIINNMRELAKCKKGNLGYSYLIRTEADGFGIESNIHEIYDAAILAKDIGCDYFEVKPSYAYVGGRNHELVKHTKERMEEAKCEIAKLDQLISDDFRIVQAITLEDSLNQLARSQEKEYISCPIAQLRTLVCPSGVYVCPYWRGKERFRIGDVHQQSFSDMWNSERRKKVMEYTNPKVVCDFHCLRHESNIEVLRMIDGAEVEIIKEYDRFI